MGNYGSINVYEFYLKKKVKFDDFDEKLYDEKMTRVLC
jgi:hypothetical protein